MASEPAAEAADLSAGDITEFPLARDLGAAPAEEENDFHPELFDAEQEEATRAVSGVSWAASDRVSACYSHLLVDGGDNLALDSTFDIGKAEFELLIAANRYQPQGKNDIIAFGLRGCRLRGTESIEAAGSLPLEDARPDHKNFRCVIGYYFRATGTFSAFNGSTVPWHSYMSRGIKNNMLPTGCYIYKKGTHAPENEALWVTPALRLSDASGAHSGPATVLRTTSNLVFEITDKWDNCAPGDNIHCAYSNGAFSSLGCQTVKGGMHEGLWARFQATLVPLPDNARIDYLLFTGAECAIAAAAVQNGVATGDPEVLKRLGRLRVGSEGEEVKRLQAKLGVGQTGYFGSTTKKKLTEFQAGNGIPADGIFSPAIDEGQGLGVFAAPAPGLAPAPTPSPEPETAELSRSVADGEQQANAPELVAASAPDAMPKMASSQEPAVAPVVASAVADPPSPAVEPAPAPVPQPEALMASAPAPAPEPQPAPEPVAVAQPAPAPAPAPDPGPKPGVLLTAETFKKFAPAAKAEFISAIGAQGDAILARFGINANAKRFCHFMAQVAHESAGFKAVEENLNYSADRMIAVFPRARISASEAQQLSRKPQAIAERVYGLGHPAKARELGNTQSGDGFRYRGRGFIQLTGRSNYRDIGQRIGLDLEGNPDLAAQPANALLCAAAFWDRTKLNELADQNKIEIITKRINGAHHGLDDRKTKFEAAQRIWGGATRDLLEGVGKSLDPSMMGGRPTLQYGDLGPDVLEAKRLLADAGYSDFLMDEDFSKATHVAVVRFKMDRGLPGDGIVDADTWTALQSGAQFETGRSGKAAADDEEEASRRRGHKIEGLGRLLFVAAAVVVAVRLVLDRGLVVPAAPWDWTVVGFVVVTAIISLALMTIGNAMVREGRVRRVSAEPLADFGMRAPPDGTESEMETSKAA